MPGRGTESKTEGAARVHLYALAEELKRIFKSIGQAPTSFIRNSPIPLHVSPDTISRYMRGATEPTITTLIRLALAFDVSGHKMKPFDLVALVAKSVYGAVAGDYDDDDLAIDVEPLGEVPGMPLQVVRDYQSLSAVDREVAARELLAAIARDFPLFNGNRLEQIQILVSEAVGRSNRKRFADDCHISESVVKAIENGLWGKVSMTEANLTCLCSRVRDPNGRLGEYGFFSPLLSPADYLSLLNSVRVDAPPLEYGANQEA